MKKGCFFRFPRKLEKTPVFLLFLQIIYMKTQNILKIYQKSLKKRKLNQKNVTIVKAFEDSYEYIET